METENKRCESEDRSRAGQPDGHRKGAGWKRSHLGEAGKIGDATGVVHVARQEHVAFVAPLLTPAAAREGTA